MKSQIFRTAAGLSSALFFLFSGAASAATVTVHVGVGGYREPGDVRWLHGPGFYFHACLRRDPARRHGSVDLGRRYSQHHLRLSGKSLGILEFRRAQRRRHLHACLSRPRNFSILLQCPRQLLRDDRDGVRRRLNSHADPGPAAEHFHTDGGADGRSSAHRGFHHWWHDPKKVVLRAIGPSLAGFGIANPLADPVLELHGADGSLITMNDNWKDTQQTRSRRADSSRRTTWSQPSFRRLIPVATPRL